MAAPVFQSADGSAVQSTNPISHTIPAGWSAGDLALAVICSGSRSVSTPPSGWTLEGSNTSVSSARLFVYSRTLESGDLGASFSWSFSGGSPYNGRVIYLRITGHSTTDPTDTSNTGFDASGVTSHPSPVLTTTVADTLLVRSAVNNASAALSASSGDTGTKQYEQTSDQAVSIWTFARAGTGAESAAATYSTSANKTLSWVSVAIAPSAGGGSSFAPYLHQPQTWQFVGRK
jgi:hypothetical protein